MTTIVTRAGKGSALTHNEVDANFTGLDDADEAEAVARAAADVAVAAACDAAIASSIAGAQPVNANLTAIAGLTGAADRVPYFTGLAAVAIATLTSFGRTIIGAANAAAVISALSLGTAALANTGDFDAAGAASAVGASASSALSTHAALQTGVHGISVAAGKTLTASNTITFTATDGSTLAIGAGGTLGTAAYTASSAYVTTSGLGTGVATALGNTVNASGGFLTHGNAATLGANTFTALQTHTIGSANVGIIASTGYSLSGSNTVSAIDIAGIWNSSGQTDFFAIRLTDTARHASSRVFHIYGGAAGATDVFAIDRLGAINWNNSEALLAPATIGGGAGVRIGRTNGDTVFIGSYGNLTSSVVVGSGGVLGISGTSNGVGSSGAPQDAAGAYWSRAATATMQQGLFNVASPVAQVLQAQGSRSGTDSNVAGANYTIRSGPGTGNATPSTLILQSYVAVASGTGAQTATTGLTIDRGTAVTVGYAAASLPASAATGSRAHCTDANATTFNSTVAGGGANVVPVMFNGTNWVIA